MSSGSELVDGEKLVEVLGEGVERLIGVPLRGLLENEEVALSPKQYDLVLRFPVIEAWISCPTPIDGNVLVTCWKPLDGSISHTATPKTHITVSQH